MDTKKEIEPLSYITRGILAGGALGIFSALLGFMHNIFWSCGLGMIAGFLAGLTMANRAKKQK